MTTPDWLSPVIRRVRKAPLMPDGAGTRVLFGRAELERLLPHRAPMLLVDGIDAVDVDGQAVRGHRRFDSSDLGFAGHFPGEPVYPGMLLVEAMGQLGLTLVHFALKRTAEVPGSAVPPRVRATHVHHATFLAPVMPGDRVVLHAAAVAESGLTMTVAGQAFKHDTLAAYAVAEVYIDE